LFLVFVYLVLYLARNRLAEFGTIFERYFTPMVAFAALALMVSFVGAPWFTALGQRLERFNITSAHVFLTVWLVLSLVAGPAIFRKYYATRLQFLAAAQCLRDNGLSDFAFAVEDHIHSLLIANGRGHFDRSSREVAFDDPVKPSPERLAELQRVCPGIEPSYVQELRSTRIYLAANAF
jgi:hypothetical protein